MKKVKFYIFTALSALMIVSCSDFGDMNDDPNSATSVPASTLLTTAQYRFYDRLNGTSLNADFGLLMVQQWAQNEYTEDSRYNYDVTSFNGTWGFLYTDVLKELQAASDLVAALDIDEGIKANQQYIIDIMEAQVFGVLTDGFGDVPYSEALSDVSLPKYDSQQEIYIGILETLDAAATGLNTSKASFSSGEVLFGGNVSAWKKFANSLMLRYASRLLDVDSTIASSYINKAISGGLMTSNMDNADFNYPNVDARANPLYRNYSPQISNRDDYCISELLVEELKDLGDPRLDMFAKLASGGDYVGMPYGLSDNDATALKPTTSRPNDAVREATTPFHVLVYAEVEFLLAEIYERNIGISGDSEAAYNNAVTASMEQWGITDSAAISAYLAANSYDAANWDESIGNQKWIALYMNGFEAWNEWRRLDQPVLTPTSEGVISSIPVKLPYPLSETQTNSANLDLVTSDPGNLTTKMWWDIN
ncbi:SusD/RagB family nutrient-binding outer membrane lipoprotein [Urechidicola sp. KH5]